MTILERDGYLVQPHTSAGRVPTDRGYRYYVDHLSPGALMDTTREQIDAFFSSVHRELERILKQTTELLSDITHFPAVVLGPGLRGHVIKDARLLAVEPGVALLILVTDGGRVHQSLLRTAAPLTPTVEASIASPRILALTRAPGSPETQFRATR